MAYVQTHFNCVTQEIVRPDKAIPFPDLNLPTPHPDSNDDLPDEDGPYDERERKPPDSYRDWWYHSDHLGSSTYLTDNFGRPSHYYETLPFGEMIVEHNQSSFYDNKYKFNGKELDDATQMYYYGARYYDPRISIFVSVDPLAEKYLNMTPYNYVANNPINAIDPDGRDFRMIIQRDKKGNIVTITLHGTVYLQGNGASQEMADKMNKAFGDKFSGYKDINGVKVGLDVVYAYDKNNFRNKNNLRAGENIFNVRTDMPASEASFVRGFSKGDSFFTGNTGEINNKSRNLAKTVIHETLHFLGLSDRYDDFSGDGSPRGKVSHSGFRNDIMAGGDDFLDVHYENIINFGKSLPRNENENGFQFNSSNSNYDRASKTGLRNGSEPTTHYHEESKQVR